ncbi:MAG: SpoVG family protein [Firmicutes bacterium]|nr:SpoVG family protein [Bacillota bacterium]
MNITEVRVRLIKKDEAKIKGIASLTIDNCFVVHDIKILQGTREEGTYFINMPCRKTPNGDYKDVVHPLNKETREMLSNLVLKEFEAEMQKAQIYEEAAATS